MPRTNADAVAKIFDTELSTDANGEIEAWIEIATELVDDISEADSSITPTRLEKIEKLLAAHFVATQDPRAAKESGESVSITYEGDTGMRINATRYGQQASMLDPTGTLQEGGRRKASITVPKTREY
jgi:hypothetical protein